MTNLVTQTHHYPLQIIHSLSLFCAQKCVSNDNYGCGNEQIILVDGKKKFKASIFQIFDCALYIDGGKKFETFSNSCFSKTLAYIFKTKWPTDRLITRLQHMQSLFNLVPVFKNYTSQPFGNRAHQIQPHLQRDHMLAFEDFLFQFFNIFGVFGFNIILQNSPKVFNR